MTTGHSVDVTFTLPLLARLALTFTAHCLSPFPLVLSHFLPRSLGRASKSVSVSSRPPIASDLVIAIMASVQHQHSCRLWIPCFCWLPLLVICFWPFFFSVFSVIPRHYVFSCLMFRFSLWQYFSVSPLYWSFSCCLARCPYSLCWLYKDVEKVGLYFWLTFGAGLTQ